MARVKKPIDFGFIPSEYQKNIFDWIQHGVGNCVIVAKAGSGKTSTIVAAMKLIPKKQKCLFIAFNKSIADELQNRMATCSNVQAKTMHSLGFLMCRRSLGNHLEVDEYKYKSYLKNNINSLSTIDTSCMTYGDIELYLNNIQILINFARLFVAQTYDEIDKIAFKYGIELFDDEINVVLKCLEWGKTHTDTLDYTDMIWLPVELDLKPIGLQYDWVFLDEAQDTSVCVVKLFQKCFKRGSRFVAVGDPDQSINQFAGADANSFDYLLKLPHTRSMDLPISYRCAKNIIKAANSIVPDILAREDAPDGEVVGNCHIKDLKDGDMVLCRSRSPLFRLYTKLLKDNINCYINGQDIGANLIELLNSIEQNNLSMNLEQDGVFVRLYQRLFDYRNKIMRMYGLDYDDATTSSQVMNKYDTIDALTVLANGCDDKIQLIEKIRKIFANDSKGVCLSTIHKAKGLEAENVYICCSSQMPSKMAVQEWEKEQEQNLIYVAYTRAKNKLGFISEKELPPCGDMRDATDILTELSYVETKVCSILGTQPTVRMENVEIARFQLREMKPVKDLHEDDNVVTLTISKPMQIVQPKSSDLLAELLKIREAKKNGKV